MPWTPDAPNVIAARLATGWEGEFADASPDGVDASSAVAPWSALARTPAEALYGTEMGFAAEVQDFWIDTCDESLVPEQAGRLGLYQAPAQRHSGFANPPAGSTPGTVIAIGATLAGGLYRVTASVEVDGSGTESVPIEAVAVGAPGALDPDAVLEFDSPIGGLAAQQLTVDEEGISGGSPQETLEQLRQRAIAWRRRRPQGGGPGDYVTWATNVYSQAIVKELPLWGGLGRVGVAVAFPGRAATTTEINRIRSAIEAQMPIDVMALAVLAATVTPLDLELALDPDTTAVRAAVSSSFTAFLAAEPGIGGIVDLSRLGEAISSAAGEYRHRLLSPPADVVAGATELLIPGTIDWAAWP